MINTAPAVVVRAGLNGLGVVRSLARGAVPTIVMDTTRWRPAMWSRFCSTAVVDSLDEQSLVDNLLALQKRTAGQSVLFLTDDAAVKIVSEHRDRFAPPIDFIYRLSSVSTALKAKLNFTNLRNSTAAPVRA
jgi:predicted ATP-grasp superfamily ATP-dependent carboligase